MVRSTFGHQRQKVKRNAEQGKIKVKVSHNRPRWPKGFRVG